MSSVQGPFFAMLVVFVHLAHCICVYNGLSASLTSRILVNISSTALSMSDSGGYAPVDSTLTVRSTIESQQDRGERTKRTNEVIAKPSQSNMMFEDVVPQYLARDGIFTRVDDGDGFAVALSRDPCDAGRKARSEVVAVLWRDRFNDVDDGHEAIGRGAYCERGVIV